MNKKHFEFLFEHPWYEESHDSVIGYYVVYRNYDETGNIIEGGLLNIPLDDKNSPMFTYKKEDGETINGFHLENIDQTPEWFHELYKRAYRKYDELTRIRGLYK